VREIESVDLERRVVLLGAGLTPQTHELAFDHLVVALGNVTDFRGVPDYRSTRWRSRRWRTRYAYATT
jgi:NADH dehydrogenase FAD-containing subunit